MDDGCFRPRHKRPQYLGCYANLNDSSASDMRLGSKTSMKVERCVEFCRNDMKTFAGLGNHKCYCGNDFGVYNTAPDESCSSDSIYCSKDKSYKCGNQVAMGIYRSCPFRHYTKDCSATCNCASDQCNIETGLCPAAICIHGYAGPKCDLYDQCFNIPCKNGGFCQQQGDGSFVCVCRLGYEGRQCEDAVDWANPFSDPDKVLEADIFQQNQTVAPSTTIRPNVATFVGCFNDSVYSDSPKKNDWSMKTLDPPTIDQCVYYCLTKVRTYAGIKNGHICRCVQSFVFGLTTPNKCTIPCPGNGKQKCGGPKSFTVYTVCTMHFYLYDNKVCESRCNCLEGQCHASTGQCPSAMCMTGWSGPVCNVEGEGPEAQQKNYDLERMCTYASFLCLACGVGAFGQMMGTIIWWTRRKRALQRHIRDLEANKKADKKERHKLKKKWKKSIGR